MILRKYRLVPLICSSHLGCLTHCLQQQVQEGIDAVIVDSVLKIRNGLTKNAKAAEASLQAAHPINGIAGANGTAVV